MGLAFSCALLWLVHPRHSQCVNYIIQRRESLASLSYLLALYGAIRGIDSRRRAWYIASILFCALGVASKEIVVTAPFAIALYDRVYRSDSWSQIWRERRYYYLGFGVPLLLLVFLIWTTRTAIALVSSGWVFGNMRLTSAWQLPIICG